MLQGFKGEKYDIPPSAKLLGEGGSATIYQETLFGELRATKYPKKVHVIHTTSVTADESCSGFIAAYGARAVASAIAV